MLSKTTLKSRDFLASITKQIVMITLQKYGLRSAISFIPIKMLLAKKKSVAKKCADLFVKGTTSIKKNNASDHIRKLLANQIAVLCLTEKKANMKSNQHLLVHLKEMLYQLELHARQHYFCISNV